MPHYLYILYSESIDKYYVGISSNPKKRLEYHNTFYKGWTQRGRPWKLVFMKKFESKEKSRKWELWIKKQRNLSIIRDIINDDFKWI